MSDDDPSASSSAPPSAPPTPPEASTLSPTPPPSDVAPSSPQLEARSELLSRARAFLVSPQIQHQDILAKRRFLVEKGLTDNEVEGLLQELPPQLPFVPPRIYPQPPPSNLPTLLLGIARLFSWVAGGSVVLILLYRRFLLPRLISSSRARQSLKAHHLSLLRNLNESVASLKESHLENLSSLPPPQPHKEPSGFADCTTIDGALQVLDKHNEAAGKDAQWSMTDVPQLTLLRCAVAEFSKTKEASAPTTQELFMLLEAKIPWLTSPEGAEHQASLWDTLTTSSVFESTPAFTPTQPETPVTWKYTPPPTIPPSPLVTSLTSLAAAFPPTQSPSPTSNFARRTLQTLTDFTGYISTQVYVPHHGIGMGAATLSPAEEELRREIRALKGLVLNRRSFMPLKPPSVMSYRGAP